MDIIDRAQALQQADIDHALANRRPPKRGLTHCENVDCGEPISEQRQQLGARMCIDCARDEEARAAQWSTTRS